MKIAVYTISKNEEKFVKRFMASIKGVADVIVVADTGSTDNTVEALREEGAVVHEIKVDPWRFDVARNISLDLVPADIDVCVCIDLDEVLTPGWRESIEKAWGENPNTTRLRYQYVWNTLPDGRPGTTFWYDKIHVRNGYRWVKPVHEVLAYYSGQEIQSYSSGFTLYHFPDPTKSRGSYLPLLELAVQEEPDDDRSSHYLGREYMFYRMYDKSIEELKRHLALPSARWEAERAASMRYIARCYTALGNVAEAERWFMRACAEAPLEREPWVELGKHLYFQRNYSGAYAMMKRALEFKEKPLSYICDPEAWGALPADVASVSAWQIGLKKESLDLARVASEIEPDDERLRNNVTLIENSLESDDAKNS